MRLQSPRVLVTEFAACFRFYRDVMGFSVKWGAENENYASFTHLGEETVILALFDRKAMAEAVGTTHLPSNATCQDRWVLTVGVDNVDETVKDLRQRGVEGVTDPKDYRDWGIRCAYVRDPDGTLIEISSGLDLSEWSEELREKAREYGQA